MVLPDGDAAGRCTAGRLAVQISVDEVKVIRGRGQVKAVFAPAVLLTLVMFRWKRVPEPESGAKSFEKADMRSVLIGPPPGRTLPDTFQLLAVSPALETGGLWKVTTDESKVKSPWNPIRLSAALIVEVTTG